MKYVQGSLNIQDWMKIFEAETLDTSSCAYIVVC